MCQQCPPPVDESKKIVAFPGRSSAVQHVNDVHQEATVGKTDREIGQTLVVHQKLKLILVRLDQVP